jgi:hypothetical protein
MWSYLSRGAGGGTAARIEAGPALLGSLSGNSIPQCGHFGRDSLPMLSADMTRLFHIRQFVEGGSKRRRGGIVAAVENGGAHWCIFGSREDSVSRYLAQLCREAQECDPIWSFGKKFVGAC